MSGSMNSSHPSFLSFNRLTLGLFGLALLLSASVSGCSSEGGEEEGNTDTDTSSADGDVDTDVDMDSDADTEDTQDTMGGDRYVRYVLWVRY